MEALADFCRGLPSCERPDWIERTAAEAVLRYPTSAACVILGRAFRLVGYRHPKGSEVRKKMWVSALDSYRDASELDPKSTEALDGMAKLLVELGSRAEAIGVYDRRLDLASGHTPTLYAKGQQQRMLRRYREAVETFTELLHYEPQRVDVHCYRARCLIGLEAYDEALRAAHEGIQAGPQGDPVRTRGGGWGYVALCYAVVGDAHRLKSDLKQALTAYDESLRLVNYEPLLLLKPVNDVRINRGITLCKLGRFPEGAAEFRRVLNRSPDNAVARRNLELVENYVALKAKVEGGGETVANELFIAELDLDKFDRDRARVRYAELKDLTEDQTERIEDRLTAMEMSGLLASAQTLIAGGKWAEASIAYKAIVEKLPDNTNAWFNLGYSLHAQGQLDEALVAHKKAAARPGPNQILGTYNTACAYALKGDKDKAFEWLRKAAKAGYDDTEHMVGDSDMDSLRDDPRYKKIIELMKGK